VDRKVERIGGIWAPLFPNVTEIAFASTNGLPGTIDARTFMEMRLLRITFDDKLSAIDGLPLILASRPGESIESTFKGRDPITFV
jgi:hypothetical protein